jgi:hypothetical protein
MRQPSVNKLRKVFRLRFRPDSPAKVGDDEKDCWSQGVSRCVFSAADCEGPGDAGTYCRNSKSSVYTSGLVVQVVDFKF